MLNHKDLNIQKFKFRSLHPSVLIGTASDRYAGWIGQIYSLNRYTSGILERKHTAGGRSFKEKVLPIESGQEYFEHFPVLEIYYTFYRLLLDENSSPTQNYRHHPSALSFPKSLPTYNSKSLSCSCQFFISFSQSPILDHKEIFCIILLSGLREIERPRNHGLTLNNHNPILN